MSNLIEHYGLIGDGETAALVGRNGSIDWLCWPRFDSDACFAALLGTKRHGCWKIAPLDAAETQRRYQHDTLILKTDHATDDGSVRVIDFMPIRHGASVLVRIVMGLHGEIRLRSAMNLVFDYGSMPPWIELDGQNALARVGPDLVVLHAPVPLFLGGDEIVADFTVREGDELAFALSYGNSAEPAPKSIDARTALADTAAYWRGWISRFERKTDWPEAVRRSLLTLKALIYKPTGAIIAAPTTSLPEAPGGEMNWDYRFFWLRD